jgi:hypothetical protein
MENIKNFTQFLLLLEARGSAIAVRTVVKDIINLFKSGDIGTFHLPQDRNTSFTEYRYFPEVETDRDSKRQCRSKFASYVNLG